MEWNKYVPDAMPGENEYDYERRKREEAETSVGLLSGLLYTLIFAFKIAAAFGLFLYLGFLLSKKMLGQDTDEFKIWTLALFISYLNFCIVYFFKGIVIGLLRKKRILWILPWTLCVITCCIIPAFIVKSFTASMFNLVQRESTFCIIISWGAFVLSALYVYSIYQFKTPTAPYILYWSYKLGLKVFK